MYDVTRRQAIKMAATTGAVAAGAAAWGAEPAQAQDDAKKSKGREEKPARKTEAPPDFKTRLSHPEALEAAEELADRMLGDIAFSQPDPYGAKRGNAGHAEGDKAKARHQEKVDASILSRCSTRPTILKTETGLAFGLEMDYVRKFFISCGEGECRVDFYHSRTEFDQGNAAFSSYNVAAGYSGTLLYRNSNPIQVYARVTTLVAPNSIYVHMEWYC